MDVDLTDPRDYHIWDEAYVIAIYSLSNEHYTWLTYEVTNPKNKQCKPPEWSLEIEDACEYPRLDTAELALRVLNKFWPPSEDELRFIFRTSYEIKFIPTMAEELDPFKCDQSSLSS